MKILAVGGGSGGHVTPIVAVLRELKKHHQKAEVRFWCDFKFAPQARSIMAQFDNKLPIERIFSGKFRRYHHLKWWQHFTIPSVLFPNILDTLFLGLGVIQSLVKLTLWRPDVVFAKGGFVCLPVGVAARMLHIPLVIHDSDAHPGLTNRVLGRWAEVIGTGAPLKYYSYPEGKARYVGIPVGEEFVPFSDERRRIEKTKLGLNPKLPLVVITGGGLGAKRINDAVIKRLASMLELSSVILISGTGQYDELLPLTPQNDERFQLHAFVSKDMAEMLGAADIVVARAGATTLLELAAAARPTILVPNGNLTGGHQLKNAKVYTDAGAVEVIDDRELEANPQILVDAIGALLANPVKQKQMAEVFHAMAKPEAASEMAAIIEQVGSKKHHEII